MCMNKVTNTFDPPLTHEVKAWKVLYKNEDNGKYYSEFRRHMHPNGFKPNRWYVNKGSKPIYTYDSSYPIGFHAFTTKKGAENWAFSDMYVVPVLLTNIVARGRQDGHICIVARKMKILEKKKGK